MGDLEQASRCLDDLKIAHEQSPKGFGLVVDLAVLYGCMGDFDKAFHYLEKAISNRVGSIMMFKGDPLLSPIKEDSRFEKMVELIGEVPELYF